MKTFFLSLLVTFISIFVAQAQTVISLPDVAPPNKVDHITDQAVFTDSAVDAHVIWAAPGFKKNRIGAPVHEQIFVLEGKLLFTLNGKTQELTAGHWLILPANTPHTLEVLGDETVKLLAVQDRPAS
jgi:mannose-6-phosphate isomerase-like protein (cupin superfamily)